MLNRRTFLTGTAGFAVIGLPLGNALAAGISGIEMAAMRGSISATDLGVKPGALDDQSKAFAKMLREADERDTSIFLPASTYVVSNLTLPRRTRLFGVPGATRIVYGGGGHFVMAENAQHIEFGGLAFDGANQALADYTDGLIYLRAIDHAVFYNCQVTGSSSDAILFERVGGSIENTTVSGAAGSGIHSIDAQGMRISGNVVSDCGDGGILVHRWQSAEDGTIITGNRIERILARSGGTGQNGNGINAFRAGNVIIANNMVSDCAFSAVRANSANNVQINGNTCIRSGETAIYSEFSFEGAVISGNVVDGAANGISMVNFNEGGRLATCSANVVRNLSTTGPYQPEGAGFGTGISFEADTAATGNVIENAPLYGMQIGWGPYLRDIVATGNVIRQAGTGIAVSVVEGSGSAILTDNVIAGTKHGAIVGQRWADPVTGDLALTGTAGYAHLTVERNHVT